MGGEGKSPMQNLSRYLDFEEIKEKNSPLLKHRLCIVTFFQRVQHVEREITLN